MKKVNFNNLENIEIPDSWAQTAIQLPSASKSKQKVAFQKLYRNIAYAACFLAVCALSVSLFIYTQKGDILNSVTPTDNHVETALSSAFTQTEKSSETHSPTVFEADPTTALVEPTEESNEDTLIEETQSTTQKPTKTPTIPQPRPTVATEPSDDDDTSSDIMKPDGPQTEPQKEKKCIGVFPQDLLSGNSTVYFMIKSTDEEPVESPSFYEATIESVINGQVSASFYPIKAGLVNKTGTYEFYFFNADYELVYTGQTYIFVG